jgi:poly(3-hydroxybutyrate) depolymerase
LDLNEFLMERRLSLSSLVMRLPGVVLALATTIYAEPPTFKDALVIAPTAPSVRSVITPDAVGASIVAGTWVPPKAGDEIVAASGTKRVWEPAAVGPDGKLEHASLRGGYAYVPVESDVEQVVLLAATGHSLAYVNGEAHMGDPYSHGYVRLPVVLKAGRNDVLIRGGRGGMRLALTSIEPGLTLDAADATLPDAIEGAGGELLGAVVVVNSSREWVNGATIVAGEAGGKQTATPVAAIPPLSVRKSGFSFELAPKQGVKEAMVLLHVLSGTEAKRSGSEAHISIRVRAPNETRKVTFRSDVDGSVQYYALRPAPSTNGKHAGLGLILSLHGAGVEGLGQADAYTQKDWADIVCPTNRRQFGFDWEDWGRLDAMEVLDLATVALKPDPRRVYLTGHSMGGHGTWHIGAHFTDRFAAIAPSAGWISFWTYSGAEAYKGGTPLDNVLKRAASASDTLALSSNYAEVGVYILHGDRDDNVPVSQARQMRTRLGEFHPDFVYYERPGAGHWWGNECVDWSPLMEFFKGRARPEVRDIRRVEFATAHPGISAKNDWVTIEAQTRPMMTSSVKISFDPETRSFSGPTQNVSRLTLDLSALSVPGIVQRGAEMVEGRVLEPGKPLAIELDQQKLADVPWPSAEPRITLYREGDQWRVGGWAPATLKGPHRAGPFKDAFRHNMIFVVGTGGTDEERAVALARARFDSASFWYRGNASPALVLDKDFDAAADANRNVILYGNADTNSAWKALLGDSPVQVSAGKVTVGERTMQGVDLACLFIRPRPGSDRASVAAIAGSGPAGMRLTQRVPYFQSGVGVPDWFVVGPEAMDTGIRGIRGAGFFANDWGISTEDSGWAETAPSAP